MLTDSTSALSISELSDRLDQCLVRDRHRFQQQLRRLSAAHASGSPDKEKLAALAQSLVQRIDASVATVARRASRLPILQWPDLPVVERLEDLQQAIRDHQVVVVAGETGSGKTTQLPKICLSMGRGVHGMIAHTQPRRLAARAMATRIAEECQSTLGDLVGYRVRFTDQVSDDTLVKLMTDGMLLAELQHDPFLSQYDTLIIDEAHERSLNIDFLLGYIKRLLPKRPDLKVIVTSATIDHERFARHFNHAPYVEVSGRTFPVTVHYRPAEKEQDLTRQIEEVLLEIEATERKSGRPASCDVLVFFSGERDIREAHRHLKKCGFRDTEFLPLYARLTPQEQNKVFSGHKGRRVVLSTNVAETSLTVPGIRYVIDTGTARISRYSVQAKVQRLPIEPVSQASAEQRKGRSGRIMPGDCYRLYSEEDFLSRPKFTDPEIQRTNLAAVILQMANQRLGDLEEFPFIDMPDGRFVRDGYRLLEELGAWQDNTLTPLGKTLARLPLDPRLGRMLLAASELGCVEPVLVIVSALAVQDARDRPQELSQQADQAHQPFNDKDSDFIFYLNLWRWSEQQREDLPRNQYEKRLKKNFLSPMRMREWRDVHRQLLLACKDLKLNSKDAVKADIKGGTKNGTKNDTREDIRNPTESPSFEPIHRALLTGLLGNIIKRTEEGEWLSTRNRKPFLWPGSALAKNKASWLMAAEQVETSRLFARTLARIDPGWIELHAEHLLKRSYLEPHWAKKRGAVLAKEQLSLFGLIISSGKRVQYTKQDPVLARELLIREGMVEGQLSREPEFIRANRLLFEALQDVENKLRRRDLLADEEKRYSFYEHHLPEDLLTLTDIESWYGKRASAEQKQALLMDEDFLLDDSVAASEEQFPSFIQIEGARFQLEYQFGPANGTDGVTVLVPVQALPLLSSSHLEWLVPGLLSEKIEALIRALPKAKRRQFVPVPDYVRALMGRLTPASEPLLPAMTRELQRMTGVRIELEEWSIEDLPEHLRFHIKVLDGSLDGNTVLAESQQLALLQEQFFEQSAALLKAVIAPPEIRARDWQFGDIAILQEQDHQGVSVRMFPALEDLHDVVQLTYFSDQDEANYRHCRALARLISFKMTAQYRELDQMMTRQPEYQKVTGKNRVLRDDLLGRVIADHFAVTADIRNEKAFIAMLDGGRSSFLPAAHKMLSAKLALLQQWQSLSRQLEKNFPLAWAHAHADIKDQLAGLFVGGWLEKVPGEWLAEYPRYLRAIAARVDKLGDQTGRDRAHTLVLAPLYQQLQTRAADRALWQWPPALLAYRFALEEFRVSLFAQQLGTRIPVSEKRLRQLWEQC